MRMSIFKTLFSNEKIKKRKLEEKFSLLKEIERILSSCTTKEQADVALDWADRLYRIHFNLDYKEELLNSEYKEFLTYFLFTRNCMTLALDNKGGINHSRNVTHTNSDINSKFKYQNGLTDA